MEAATIPSSQKAKDTTCQVHPSKLITYVVHNAKHAEETVLS